MREHDTEGQRAEAYMGRHGITAVEVEMLANLAATLGYLGTDLEEVWGEVPDPAAYAALVERLSGSLYPQLYEEEPPEPPEAPDMSGSTPGANR